MKYTRSGRKGFAVRFLLIIPVIFLLLTLTVMLLWNAVLPPVLGVNSLGYWQAGGLLLLCRILFGGFGFQRPKGGPGRGGPPGRFKNMTPEERERIRAEWKKRCGKQ